MFTTGDTGYGTSPATPPQGHQPPPGFLAVNRAGGGAQLPNNPKEDDGEGQFCRTTVWCGRCSTDPTISGPVGMILCPDRAPSLEVLISRCSQGGRGCSYCMTSGMSGVPSVKASEWGAG